MKKLILILLLIPLGLFAQSTGENEATDIKMSKEDSLQTAINVQRYIGKQLKLEISEKNKSTQQKVDEALAKKAKESADILKLQDQLEAIKTRNDSLKKEKMK